MLRHISDISYVQNRSSGFHLEEWSSRTLCRGRSSTSNCVQINFSSWCHGARTRCSAPRLSFTRGDFRNICGNPHDLRLGKPIADGLEKTTVNPRRTALSASPLAFSISWPLIPTRIRSVRCAWHDPRQMTKRTLCRRIAVLLREQEVIALLNAKELAMEVLSVTKAYAVRA